MKGFYKSFFGFWFRLFGWKSVGDKPHELKKYVIAVGPHTSNWDFAVGYCIKHIHDLHPDFLAKHSLFKIPLVGWFLRNMGGHPVDRSKKTNMVDQVVEKFETLDKFIMAITPEGTRSYAPEWKTGFYRIAMKVQVPIILVGMDYKNREVVFSDPMIPTGDMDADFEKMRVFFRKMTGKRPELGID